MKKKQLGRLEEQRSKLELQATDKVRELPSIQLTYSRKVLGYVVIVLV